jgi:hypothetical protein
VCCAGDALGNIALLDINGKELWERHVKSMITQVRLRGNRYIMLYQLTIRVLQTQLERPLLEVCRSAWQQPGAADALAVQQRCAFASGHASCLHHSKLRSYMRS